MSMPYTLFDSKQLYQNETVYWTQSTNGAASGLTFDSNYSSITLTSGTAAGGWASAQTRTYWNYQSGKSQLALMTGNFYGGVANVIKRIGIFDDNNGLYFMLSGTTASIGVRTFTSGAAVDTVVTQSAWNIDHFDGTGQSGITLNTSEAQVFVIDYQWLGVGKIRFGFVYNDNIYYVHEVYNANINPYVYMQRPNLPIRYEIRNGAAQSTAPILSQICSAVFSEAGGVDNIGYKNSITTAITGVAVSTTAFTPVLAIRLQSTFTRGAACKPDSFWAAPIGTSNGGYFGMCYNCQVSGGTWVNVTNSAVQYNATMTSMSTTNSAAVMSDNMGFGKSGPGASFLNLMQYLWAGFDYTETVPDVWVLWAKDSSGATYIGGINWEEYR
jgi:hypothetical protein